MTLLVAGHETTATELSWAFERLVRNADALARLDRRRRRRRRRVRDGDDPRDAAPPPGPVDRRPAARQAARSRSAVAPSEPGCHLVPNVYLVHHDPDIYPDPYAFRPERFLEDEPGTYTWIPFGGGRRRCLGASFALLEMDIVLRAILSRMEVRAGGAGLEAHRRRMITVVPAEGAAGRPDGARTRRRGWGTRPPDRWPRWRPELTI